MGLSLIHRRRGQKNLAIRMCPFIFSQNQSNADSSSLYSWHMFVNLDGSLKDIVAAFNKRVSR